MNPNETQKLKGVAMGAGYFSQFHLDAWNQISGVEMVAICDRELDAAEVQAASFAIPTTYANPTEMLDKERPDFVDIITRPDSHLELCQAAAERNVAIICQKPLAPTFDEAKELVSIAQRAHVPLMVHENFRFQPWHREIKNLLASGVIGDRTQSISVNCRMGDGWQSDAYLSRQPYFRTMPQLLVYETCVHFIDTFRYLFGDVTSVYAKLRRLNPEIRGEDTGCVLLEFAAGQQGLINATRFHESFADNPRYTFGHFTIDGNGGTLTLEADGTIQIKKLGEPPVVHQYSPSNKGFAGDCVLSTQQHFVEQLRGQEPFETSGEDYLKTLAVQEAIYQSSSTNLPVNVQH